MTLKFTKNPENNIVGIVDTGPKKTPVSTLIPVDENGHLIIIFCKNIALNILCLPAPISKPKKRIYIEVFRIQLL